MNDLKAIANLMKLATEAVMHNKYKTLKNLKYFTCRVGTGKATNVSTTNKGIHKNYVLTYGLKMLESKQTKKQAMGWTTGKEIQERKYFKNPSFKDMIVAVILHEYAHVIQVQDGGRSKGSVHNKHFYEILDGFYEKNYHIELDKYLSAFPAYSTAKYINDDKSFTKVDLVGVDYILIKGRTKNFPVKIDRLNPKRIKCFTNQGTEMNVPYLFVEKIITKDEFFNYGGKNNKSKSMNMNESDFDMIKNKSYSYFEILYKGKVEYFKVQRFNQKTISAINVENGEAYKIGYGLVKKGYKTLPSNIKEVKIQKEESKYSQRDLKESMYFEIDMNGTVETFKVIKANTKRVKAKRIKNNEVWNIYYSSILKVYN